MGPNGPTTVCRADGLCHECYDVTIRKPKLVQKMMDDLLSEDPKKS